MKKILLIEDDPVVGMVYQRGLTKHGFTVDLATDGAKGLERLSAFQPDAIVLDLMMPKIGGVEFLKRLRAQEAFRDLPVIVLTNACVPAFIEQATQAGANQVMDKSRATPVAIAELIYTKLNLGSENPVAAAS
jgi:chemosensory pili system protein ChpA (sensor histidine kinase/response regulator)